jgi:hypothetical protein
VTGLAAGIALAFGLGGAPAASHALSAGTRQATAPAGSAAAIQTDAFTLTSNANGTDTLTLPLRQVLDPAAFQRALTQHHIPALVKSGVYCVSRLEPANPVFTGIFTVKSRYVPPRPGGTAPRGGVPSPGQLLSGAVVVISPAKIPSGTELFFGYASNDRAMFLSLIDANSYTCRSQPPLPAQPGRP